jgi:hypothetical protein
MTNLEFLNSISKTERKNASMSILFDEWDIDLEEICDKWKDKKLRLWSVLCRFYIDFNRKEKDRNKIRPIGRTREEARANLIKLLQKNFRDYNRQKDTVCDQWKDPDEKKVEKKVREITLESGETILIKVR